MHRLNAQILSCGKRPTPGSCFGPNLSKTQGTDAGVKGTIIFQRKGPNDDWGDTITIPLSSLHKDEGYRLELHSVELRHLFGEVTDISKNVSLKGVILF